MTKTIMLLLAFAVTDPEGFEKDERVHILSQHFDTQLECKLFIDNWEGLIRSRGLASAQDMLADGYKVELTYIGCTPAPDLDKK